MDYLDVEEQLVEVIRKFPDDEDSAENYFRSLLKSDDELQENFSEWCVSKGYSERKAFRTVYEEYAVLKNKAWESMLFDEETDL
ncbi:MAG: hypothetical protein LUC18_01440 [Porphyromonadaceae bacterium]|nr:hypothetical protein [Porphyromonadaceae bacterium]